MELQSEHLPSLVRRVQARIELDYKRDIQRPSAHFGRTHSLPWLPRAPQVKNGDDAAAIKQADGSYLLFATDAMRAEFVRQDPWFSGYSAVMVNISDIAAMGGRPLAIVDVLYLGSDASDRVLLGMQEASAAFGVPIVGGHTCRHDGPTLVSCAIVGTAQALLESDQARPGQELLYAVDLRGVFRSAIAFNAATTRSEAELRRQVSLLSELAEERLVSAAKDVSNAGLLGTLTMLLESSGVGAEIDLASVPAPGGIDPLRWLMAFPSFGFVMAVDQRQVDPVRRRFHAAGVSCERIGTTTSSPTFSVQHGTVRQTFADLRVPFTGFGKTPEALAG